MGHGDHARERIIDATERVLGREGGEGVTIAAVAKEAGVSKGGLFYHFASKELLISALVERYVASFDARMARAGDEPGAAAAAFLASIERAEDVDRSRDRALLAAVAIDPRALDALRARYEHWQTRLDADGLPPDVAGIVRYAVDGLWFADALDVAPAAGTARAEVVAALRALVAAAVAEARPSAR